MIWYHQAYDLNHNIFRTLSLLEFHDEFSITIPKLKILNFYLLFPSHIVDIRFPRSAVKYRKIFKGLDDKYNKVSNPKITFSKLSPLNDTTYGALASIGLVNKEDFKKGIVSRTSEELNSQLYDKILGYQEKNKNLFEFLVLELAELSLTGKKGLKQRTNLVDFRYDPR